jgi:peptidyl-dipeptidase Dcp
MARRELWSTLSPQSTVVAAALLLGCAASGAQIASQFGPSNPFYAPSTLPFQAPPFDRIKDSDYQPAIDAGMAEQLREVDTIANNPAPPTFENTFVALERSGRLLDRVSRVFYGVTGANTDPVLQQVQRIEAPRRAAHDDAIYLNSKLFQRIATVYRERGSLHLDPESRCLVEVVYRRFVHQGANLSEGDKQKLKKLNEEESALSNV